MDSSMAQSEDSGLSSSAESQAPAAELSPTASSLSPKPEDINKRLFISFKTASARRWRRPNPNQDFPDITHPLLYIYCDENFIAEFGGSPVTANSRARVPRATFTPIELDDQACETASTTTTLRSSSSSSASSIPRAARSFPPELPILISRKRVSSTNEPFLDISAIQLCDEIRFNFIRESTGDYIYPPGRQIRILHKGFENRIRQVDCAPNNPPPDPRVPYVDKTRCRGLVSSHNLLPLGGFADCRKTFNTVSHRLQEECQPGYHPGYDEDRTCREDQ